MRTKAVEGVLRVEITRLEPRPEIGLTYDGLSGLSQRPMLRDIIEELTRQGPATLKTFLKAMSKAGGGSVHVYFADYVSYGVGGGDATSEFFFGTYLILQVGPTRPFHGDTLESLVMVRPGKNEVYPLDDVRGK